MKPNTLFAIFLAVVLCLTAASVTAQTQHPWQRLQSPTAAQVRSVWTNPPSEYGPEPYYGLNGAVTLEVVDRDLDQMKSLGFRAVTVQAGYNMPFDYLSPEYFAFFQKFVAEAKKRDMRVWIVDDAGYPSGFAGGKFTSEKPELRMQALEVAQRIPVKGGDSVNQAVTPETVAVSAIAEDGQSVSIPVSNGKISWTAPAGNWTVIVVEHQFRTSPTRSDTNKKRVKDTEQSLEDYLSADATNQYLQFTHQQYKKYVGDEFGRTILGFRGDEPDYSIRGIPWTPEFFARFQQLKGYDIRPYLAAFLLPPSSPLTPHQARARADYWDVFSRLFAAGFFRVQGDWCAANHLEYQVHLNHEEMELQLAHSEGDFFRDMQYVQVPGIDSIWHQIWTDTISDFPRLASSVSHVYGKPRSFTETFAAYRPQPDIAMARYILNEQFVRGINLIEMMYFPATSAGARPAPSFMRDPAFPALAAYVRRLSYLMSMGRPTADVALYLPTSSLWMNDKAADDAFVSTERLLSEHQVNFDIVSEDALATDLIPGKGTLATASGNAYRTVILPSTPLLSQAALDRLRSFASTGGHVLFLGRTPTLIAGKTILDARSATPSDFSWAITETSAQLPITPTPPAQPPAAAPAPQDVAPAILQALRAAVPTRELRLDHPAPALRILPRRWKDADVYLLFNEGPAALDNTATLATKGHHAQVWYPETGQIAPQPSTATKSGLKIPLSLKPYETRVLVVRSSPVR